MHQISIRYGQLSSRIHQFTNHSNTLNHTKNPNICNSIECSSIDINSVWFVFEGLRIGRIWSTQYTWWNHVWYMGKSGDFRMGFLCPMCAATDKIRITCHNIAYSTKECVCSAKKHHAHMIHILECIRTHTSKAQGHGYNVYSSVQPIATHSTHIICEKHYRKQHGWKSDPTHNTATRIRCVWDVAFSTSTK